MKRCFKILIPVCTLAFCVSYTALAQQWQHPYHDGTTQVYSHRDNTDWKIFHHYRLDPKGNLMFHRMKQDFNTYYDAGSFTIKDSSLMFDPNQQMYFGGVNFPENFPVSIPSADSILVFQDEEYVTAVVERRFDTTVNNETVRAFALRIPGMRYLRERLFIIADRYGILSQSEGLHDVYNLHSMHSNDISFNWNTKSRDVMPICEGNVSQYYMNEICIFSEPFNGRGTMYNSYISENPITVNGKTYIETHFGWLRNDSTGLYILIDSTREGLVASSNLTIGSPVYFHAQRSPVMPWGTICVAFVTDTATIERFGKQRFVASLTTEKGVNDLPLCIPVDEIVEGVGILIEPISQCTFIGSYTWELRYFSVCGETYGTFVSAPPLPEPASFSLSPAYPNPVSRDAAASIEVSVTRAGDFQMALYNEAGMLLRQWSQSLQPGTHAIPLDTRGLVPGAYRLSVQSGEGQDSEWVVVR